MCAPPKKVARMRIYDIVSESPLTIRNAEGLVFSPPDKDVIELGGFSSTESISPTKMITRLESLTGFFVIGFTKVNGDDRTMYAHVHARPEGGIMKIHDLEQNNTELRCCRLDSVHTLIVDNNRYVVNKRKAASQGDTKKRKRKPVV